MTSGVDAENVHEDNGEADDEGQQRPEHTVYDGRLCHHVQYHVTRIVGVGKADVVDARDAISLGKVFHSSDIVLADTITLVK